MIRTNLLSNQSFGLEMDTKDLAESIYYLQKHRVSFCGGSTLHPDAR